MEEVCFQRNTKFFEDGVQPFSQLGLPYSPHSLAGYSGLFFFFFFLQWTILVEVGKMELRVSERFLKQKLACCSRDRQFWKHANETEAGNQIKRDAMYSLLSSPQTGVFPGSAGGIRGKNIYITSNRYASCPLREVSSQHLPRRQWSTITHSWAAVFTPKSQRTL